MTAYPGTLPSPELDGFAAAVDMGLIRADYPVNQAQRRVYKSMPHTFSLSFVMSVTVWGSWYDWAVANGYRWFTMSLPSLYAGLAGTDRSAMLVRFCSDIQSVKVSQTDVRVTVIAETAPSAYGAFLAAT